MSYLCSVKFKKKAKIWPILMNIIIVIAAHTNTSMSIITKSIRWRSSSGSSSPPSYYWSSLSSPHTPMDSVYDAQIWLCADFSIRKSAGRSSLTAHRSLSQLTTSFIGSQCQGIHPALMFALPFASSKEDFSSFADSHSAIYYASNKLVNFHWPWLLVVFTRLQISSFLR